VIHRRSWEERTRYLTRMEDQLGTLPLSRWTGQWPRRCVLVSYASLWSVTRLHQALSLPAIPIHYLSDLQGVQGDHAWCRLMLGWSAPPVETTTDTEQGSEEGRYHEEGEQAERGWQPDVHSSSSATHLSGRPDQRPVPRNGRKKTQGGSQTSARALQSRRQGERM
jgi:hypothetical protein